MNFNKKHITILGSALLIVLIFIFWIIVPAFDYKDKLEYEYQKNSKRLEKILKLEAEYDKKVQLQGKRAQSSQEKNFSLFAFLEQGAAEIGLKDNIDFMRPSTQETADGWKEHIVEMSLTNMYISELVPFLYRVEHSKNRIQIKRVTMRSKPRNQAGPVNMNIVLSTMTQG
ncbi:MAG: hypothetical protein K9J81_01065 [Desulfohalobiaceae bacterium]|nr:hypothetical protein [Desulfohalobiaceae bacterium]